MKNIFSHPFAGTPKFIAGFIGTLVFRLLTPFMGMGNISPLMATELAGGKAYGPWAAGLYGALSMALLDVTMGKVGSWTVVTSLTYGVVGVWGAFFFRRRNASALNFVIAGVLGALFFDLITGVLMGPLLFGQPWMEAIIGQIPFTLRHVLGNAFFGAVLAPWFYRAIMNNPKWESSRMFRFA